MMENIHILEGALSDLCQSYNEEKFKPILEVDIAGYLYHLLVVYKNGDASMIHLSTRIHPAGGQRKYPDLIVGYITSIQSQQEYFRGYSQSDSFKKSYPGEDGTKIVDSKGFVDWLKPYIEEIEIAIEIKPFFNGFSQTQCHHRIEKSKKDIDNLGQLAQKASSCWYLMKKVIFQNQIELEI